MATWYDHLKKLFHIAFRVVDGILSVTQATLYFKAASGQHLMQQLCGTKHLLLFFLSDDNAHLRPAAFDLRLQFVHGIRLQKSDRVAFGDLCCVFIS